MLVVPREQLLALADMQLLALPELLAGDAALYLAGAGGRDPVHVDAARTPVPVLVAGCEPRRDPYRRGQRLPRQTRAVRTTEGQGNHVGPRVLAPATA